MPTNPNLSGLTVLVTRPAAQADSLCALLAQARATVQRFPTLEIVAISARDAVDAQLAAITTYDQVIFTSANAVNHAAGALPLSEMQAGRPQVFAVGASTAGALTAVGVPQVISASQAGSEALLQLSELAELAGKKVAIVRGEKPRGLLQQTLLDRGAQVSGIEVYRRTLPISSDAELKRRLAGLEPDIMVVTSRTGLANLATMLVAADRSAWLDKRLLLVSERLLSEAPMLGFSGPLMVAGGPLDEDIVATLTSWRATVAVEQNEKGMMMAENNDTTDTPSETAIESEPEESAVEPRVEPIEAQAESQADPRTSAPVARPSPGRGLSIALALLVLLVVGAAGYYWHATQYQPQQQIFAAELGSAGSEFNSVTTQFDTVRNEVNALSSSVTAYDQAIATLKERQANMAGSIEKLFARDDQGQLDWALAETEYLLLAANNRLQFERDIESAMAALEAADGRVRDLGNPSLVPVRERITADLAALKAVQPVDISGLALYLADLTERVSDLPLRDSSAFASAPTAQPLAEEQTKNWSAVAVTMWDELVDLFAVEQLEMPDGILFDANSRQLLHETLRFELASARFAALHRDSANFHASIAMVRRMGEQYFERNDAAVSNMLETLAQMEAVELKPELPDIGRSLESVRRARSKQASAP